MNRQNRKFLCVFKVKEDKNYLKCLIYREMEKQTFRQEMTVFGGSGDSTAVSSHIYAYDSHYTKGEPWNSLMKAH